VLALLSFMCCAMLGAQSTTDGAIGGTVFDSTGAVVSKAQVTVHNNGTAAEHTTTTDDSGYYRVVTLQPGSYTVTVIHQGFASFKAEQVIVSVGSLTEISPRLKVGAGQETVEVTAEAPQINYTSPEFAPTLDQTAISNLPINGGRWSNFALLTPGVVSDSNAFGLLSFRGISTLLNNNTVDGADNNQAFFSEERGRTRIGYSTPKEAVQEFQVNTSNYSAEYGRSAGGVVNTVTKSGTNAIHGEGYGYDRDNDIGAFNEFSQINVQTAPGVFKSQPLKPTNKRQMAGFGIGGPLAKDKLFWFVAYDWFHNNFPGVAVTTNPGVFFAPQTVASPNITTLATNLFHLNQTATLIPPTAGQLQSALDTYNTDLTALNTLLGVVPRTGDQNIILPKLDWQINNSNHASFTVNRMRWSSPAGIQTAPTVTRGVASFGNDFVKETWGVAKLDTSITPTIVNEVRFQYGRDFEFEFSQQPAPYEVSTLLQNKNFPNPLGLPPSVSITNGFTFGVPTFLQRPAFPDETRLQIADTLSWSRGKHTFKFGFDVSHVDDNSKNLSTQFGSYSYPDLVSYFSDLNVTNGCSTTNKTTHVTTTNECFSNFSQAFGPLGFQFQTDDVALFVADDWKILPRLSLSLGLRWERQILPAPFTNLINPNATPVNFGNRATQTGQLPNDMNNFGPRVGFAWDVFGGGKTVLRGGYGIYYARIINSTIFSALTSTGMPGSQVSFSFTPTQASPAPPVFPQIFSNLTGTGRNLTFFDRNFQNPQIHEFDLKLEHDLGWGTVVSASYLGSLGRELPDFVDTNVPLNNISSNTFQVGAGGPLKSATYTTQLFQGPRPIPTLGSMTDIFSGINSSYHALVVEANHRMSRNIQFSASYTWSHAIDFGQNQTTFTGTNFLLFPNSIAAEKGNSIYDIPNRFVANAIMTSPWKVKGWAGWLANGWELSPIVQLQNGLPYTLSVSGNAPAPLGAIGGINGSGGTNRIDILGNNSFRMPSQWEQDLRVSKTFTFQEKYKLELMTDFFNVPNKQNVMTVNNSGYSITTTNSITTASGTVNCSTLQPCLKFNPAFGSVTGTNNSNFLWTPRQIQLGARFQF
jgi:hypothetical protein